MFAQRWLRAPGLYFLALVSVALVGFLDYASGSEISFSLFYLAPLALVAYRGTRRAAVLFSIGSAIVWASLDISTRSYSHWSIGYWNALVRLGFFLIVSFALSKFREQSDREKVLATTDALTGVANGRSFFAVLEMEVRRMKRSGKPLTLAYLDMDGFKAVNDRRGHLAGDELLRLAAATMVRNVRAMDVVARLGGDEFAILLPETAVEAALTSLGRLRVALAELARATEDSPRVTFSIGATVVMAPEIDDVEELVRAADALMYRVKRGGKDGLLVEELALAAPDSG